MRSKQSGFTLVEIAIVLVIIGLLLGGVLKGQELINSAKVKNMVTDFRNLPLFIYGYQDKFKRLPGDDPAAVTNTGSVKAGNGDGRLDGSWTDGQAAPLAVGAATETYMFWEHVRRGNFAAGGTDISVATYLPTNSDGGFIGIESASQPTLTPYLTNLSGTYLACSKGILGKFAKLIDVQMDDGNGSTGSVRIVDNTGWARNTSPGNNNVTTPASVDDSTQYTVCMAF